jgi:arylsulfatase
VTEQTIEFLKQNQGNQFMCIAGFYSPHEPWVVPKEFLDLYNPDLFTLPKFPPEIDAQRNEMFFSDEELRGARHGYYAMISEVDYHIGRILTTLDELELAENTIVIYTSDHGEWLGEHLRYGKGFPGPDCISRVPFIVRWPEGIAEPNRTVSEITEAVDLVPTLLECAGIPLPYFLQGKSMCPVFRERNETHKESAIMEGTGWKTVRTRRYRYVIKASGEENLYDLASDLGEYHDVAKRPEYREIITAVRGILLKHIIATERPLPRVWPY